MGRRLYVGNLPYTTTSDDLRSWFAEHGTVTRAQSQPSRPFALTAFTDTTVPAAMPFSVADGLPARS